jgi:hypothetical protein
MTEWIDDPWIEFACDEMLEEFIRNHRQTMPEDPLSVCKESEIGYFCRSYWAWLRQTALIVCCCPTTGSTRRRTLCGFFRRPWRRWLAGPSGAHALDGRSHGSNQLQPGEVWDGGIVPTFVREIEPYGERS